MSAAVDFAPPGYDPTLTRAVHRHLWRPQTILELSQGMGIPYTPVKMALTRLQAAGLARRQVVRGRRGVYWVLSASPASASPERDE